MVEKQMVIGNLKVIVAKDYDSLSFIAGDTIATQIKRKPSSVLGLATGSTPIGTYKHLVARHQNGLSFEEVRAFNLDEYHPINKDSDQSYAYFMQENLFKHIDISPNNIDIPSGETPMPAAECVRYENSIRDVGGIDLQLLGLGLNGHIGFNEPDAHFPKMTQYTSLKQSTIDANARFFDSADDVPKHAITMGIGTIFAAESVLMLISGAAKAEIAHAVICGDITPKVPGSILQLHRNVTIILDSEAAAKL